MPTSIKFGSLVVLLAAVFATGCATQIVETPSKVTKSPVPFSEYDRVVLVRSKINGKYADHSANIKAVNKIDEHLASKLSALFNKIEVVDTSQLSARDMNSASEKVLVIKPLIKQIKFIGGAARFWVGAMAGSSAVIMDVEYWDAGAEKVLSNPGFQQTASAFSGPFGVADNKMLEEVANDVVTYTSFNM